ncbi:MAG TPA: nucleotidyl transferase AbiEii/AbiGii toxin family protein [Patescibacteria group bacterium]|nr:nucleotidyl transferase AbiEii/AbiGii toxin family protein [Patescibacteria group bacterium]
MITQALTSIVEKNKNTTNSFFIRTLLKEALQNYILNFMYNDQIYKKLFFTGGTCLRKIYGLPRLSEDLDFDFLGELDIQLFAQKTKTYFAEKLQYLDIKVKISGNNNTIFFKFPILEKIGLVKNASDASMLFVRCDFSKETTGIFKTEVNSISTGEFTFYALSYNLPTLFANKIIAFLSREFFKGSAQSIPFKGRDVFDLVWFIEQSAKQSFSLQPYWERIFKMLDLQTKNEVVQAVKKKTEMLDKKSVYTDLLPFIESTDVVQNFTENFAAIIKSKLINFKDYPDS